MSESYIIHCASHNSRLTRQCKRKRLKQWLIQQNIDVMLLQETHFTESIINTITKPFHDWEMINSFEKSNSCGCSTLINRKLRYKILNNVVGESGRLLLTNIEISDTVFSIVNMYAPND